jgi:hypothetical protein
MDENNDYGGGDVTGDVGAAIGQDVSEGSDSAGADTGNINEGYVSDIPEDTSDGDDSTGDTATGEELDDSLNDIPEDTVDGDPVDESTDTTDASQDIPEDIETTNEVPSEEEHYRDSPDTDDTNGIANDYGFTGDPDLMDEKLAGFEQDAWEAADLDERKTQIDGFADYVKEGLDLENPPAIEYYNNAVAGDYGNYDPDNNTLRINEYMLDDSEEALDTVAHELWHAKQNEAALNPDHPRSQEYQDAFDDYIGYDVDPEGYENQMVEAEARDFAEQFKNAYRERR